MFFRLNRIIVVIAVVALVFGSCASVCAVRLSFEQDPLPTGEITFDPPFATVGERSDLFVALEVTDPDLKFHADKLMLQKQRFRRNGSAVFVPIAQLRDDGKNGDALAGDHIFSGVASFHERVTGTIRLRAVGWTRRPYHKYDRTSHQSVKRQILVSRGFSVPARLACGPTGSILPVNIFEAGQGKDDFETLEFEVPEGGEAVLRVVNGARIGASIWERVALAKISVNGKRVKTVTKGTNVAEAPVDLMQGVNVLEIDKMVAKSGQLLSVRIDACADWIELDPVANAGVAGEPIGAAATVTALGLPVEGADVRFEAVGAGLEETVTTGQSGIASALLEVETAGADTLRATVLGSQPTLVDQTPIEVLSGRGLVLEQRPGSLRLEAGSDGLAEFTIDVRSVEGAQDHVTLESIVAPGGDGLAVVLGFPVEGLDVAAPRRVPVSAKATAEQPGSYTVTTTATVEDTGETFSVVLPVEVVEPGTPDPLLLGIPMATPSGVEANTPTTVIFRAQVDGTSTPPDMLFLDELDLAGEPLELAVAELRDEGNDEDTVAGDLIYSGTLEIDRPASELRFRVRAVYFGEEVVSGATSFLVTPFPREARPSDPDLLVPVPGTPSRVFANEVEMKTIPGVSPDEVERIAASIAGTVVGVIPPLRLYLVEFPGDGSANGVIEAIATLSTFSQVERAAPNFEVLNAAICFNYPGKCLPPPPCCNENECEPTAADCPDDGTDPDQWYLEKIGARQAWDRAGGGSSSVKVAVIDGGVDCGHPDLGSDRCTASTSPAVDPDHATQVAGIIAANANNGEGIAGIAWNTQVKSFALSSGYDLKAAIGDLSDETKVINISVAQKLDPDATAVANLKDAVCDAVNAGKLVVVAGGNFGNEPDEDKSYPARLNIEKECPCPDTEPGCTPKSLEKHLLAVGGSNESDGRARWGTIQRSSDAPFLDIYAPGKNIRTIASGNALHGTSLATPQVSGAAAVLWAYDAFVTPSGQTRAQAIHDRLKATGDPVSTTWDRDSTCVGDCKRLNLEAAVNVPISQMILVGDKDDFHPGDPKDEPPQSNRVKEIIDFIEHIGDIVGQNPSVDLDVNGSDRPVGLTHFFALPEQALIMSATLTLRVKGDSELVHNDAITYDQSLSPSETDPECLQKEPTQPPCYPKPFFPVILLMDLLGGEPLPGEIHEIKINFSSVPVRISGDPGPGGDWLPDPDEYRNLLPLLDDGEFNMVIGDDVTVDYSELKITYMHPASE